MSIENFKILLADANQTIIELQDENDRLQKALMEKDKALFVLKDLADSISKQALLATSIDADTNFLIDTAPWKNVMAFHDGKKPRKKG